MNRILSSLAAAGLLVCASPVFAFGTVHLLGQNAEHERITRHALGCGQAGAPAAGACFLPGALDEVAGRGGTFGAVGAPDHPANGKINDAKSHCDDGDYVAVSGYPQSEATAQAALEACRNYMISSMSAAVAAAAPLVRNGSLVDAEIPTVFNCNFNFTPGRAYCNVLEEFGVVLHAAQDFYSHSNWVDQPDASQPISLTNPAGLNHTGRAPWLDLRRSSAFPSGLMTGCYLGGLPDGTSGCPGRVTHYVLNKDKGDIDPQIGAGTTDRGKINGNFARAVEAAIDDTRDKWAQLRAALVTRYGAHDGGLMICALVSEASYARQCH